MQYLKEDVKQRIFSSALEVFKEKGYTEASMRTIAANAGIALGTVYKYFENKEDLFNSIVEPVYQQTLSEFKAFIDEESTDNPIAKVNDIYQRILEIFKRNNTELLILFDKSKGSKFEHYKEEINTIIHTILQKELVPELKQKGIEIKDEFLFYVLSTSFLEGVYTILKHLEDGERISALIQSLSHVIFDDMEKRYF